MANRRLGKYEVVERLGRGGMAEVYRAYHPSLDRFVAIKVLHPFLADDPEFKSRFEKEARNIARLKQNNIVQVYDFENDVDNENYYMVMELIEGPTLKDQLTELAERRELMPLREALRITREAALALAFAHAQGMIHRDVKPANLMLDRDSRVVLTDFGIAKIVTGVQFTASGGMVGTPAYMAPEQGLGEPGDERSDLYSLGVILFQLVTGRLPYDADTPLAIILKHLNDPVPSARGLNPELPEAVDQMITRLIAKAPETRYQSAGELIADIERIERGADGDYRDGAQVVPAGKPRTDTDTINLQISRLERASDTDRRPLPSSSGRTAAAGGVPPRRRTPFWIWILLVALIGIGIVAVGAAAFPDGINGVVALLAFGAPSATPTPTETLQSTATSTVTPSLTVTPTATSSATSTPSESPTVEPTSTQTPSITPQTPTITPTFTQTTIPSVTPLPPTATNSASPTYTPTRTDTRTPRPTVTPTNTPTMTPSPTITSTNTRTPTTTPTLTPSITPTMTPSATRTPTRTRTPSRTPTATITPTPTRTATPTITLTPSITPTATPNVTLTLIQATLFMEMQTATIAACDFDYAIIEQDPENGAYFPANQPYTRQITLLNTGTCAWERNTSLTYVEGEAFNTDGRFFIRNRVNVGEETTIEFVGRTPVAGGLKTSIWELRTPGQILIGEPLFITVNVFQSG